MTEQLIINGERVPASDGGTFDVYRSVDRRACWRRSRRRQRRTSTARSSGAGGVRVQSLGRRSRRPSAAESCSASRRRFAIGGRAGHAREPRQRQAAAAGAHRRAGGGALLRVLRGHRRQDHGQHDPARSGLSRLHHPRADRRVGADRAVELSDSDRRARRRAGARGRMHGRAEAVERSADDRAAARRDRARRAACRPACSTSCPAPAPEAGVALASHPRHQSADVHRIGRRRHRRSRRWPPRTSCPS